jgi:hypothetical protein
MSGCLRAPGDVARGRVLVAARPEREALVDGDALDAELPRPLDERRAVAVVVEEESGRAVARTELGVGLEARRPESAPPARPCRRSRRRASACSGRAGAAARCRRARSPRRASRPRRRSRAGFVSAPAGTCERTAHRGVAVEEDVLEQRLAREALDVVGLAARAVWESSGMLRVRRAGARRLSDSRGAAGRRR